MQKIKQKIVEHREKKRMEKEGVYDEGMYDTAGHHGAGIAGTGVAGTGIAGTHTGIAGETVSEVPVGVGVAEVPVVVTEEQRIREGHHHHHHHEGLVGEEVCGQKVFTELEDRPVVKERVERFVEHNPVEKQYVVETRFVGERAVPTNQPITHVGAEEYVVSAAEPGPKCPVNAGTHMDRVIDEQRRVL